MIALALLSYVSGNVIFADYLNIIYLPGSGELTVFVAALVGASLGFLWYNAYPAQIFMGDTGSTSTRWCFWNSCSANKKGIIYSDSWWNIFYGNTFSDHSKNLFQIHEEEIGAGKKSFSNGSNPSSLRDARLGRAKNCC